MLLLSFQGLFGANFSKTDPNSEVTGLAPKTDTKTDVKTAQTAYFTRQQLSENISREVTCNVTKADLDEVHNAPVINIFL